MTSAYIFHPRKDGEHLDTAEFRLRDALERAAGGRDLPVEDATQRRSIPIAGCMLYHHEGKAVVVSKADAEELAQGLAQAMGMRHRIDRYTPNYVIGGKALGGDVGKPAALVYVVS